MPTCKFLPTGTLDVNTNATLLPQKQSDDGSQIISGAMRRCTNLRVDEEGIARTRWGSTKGSTQIGPATAMLELAGDRYEFSGDELYQNEGLLASGLTDAQWSATVARPYNGTVDAIYCTNGTDMKRIEAGSVYPWGIDNPPTPLILQPKIDAMCCYTWERTQSIPGGTQINACDATTGWTDYPTDGTFSIDTARFMEGVGSLKWEGKTPTSLTATTLYTCLDLGAGGVDWSVYVNIRFWLTRSDVNAVADLPTWHLTLVDTAGVGATVQIITPTNNPNTWTLENVTLSNLSSTAPLHGTTGTLDTAHIRYFYIDRYYAMALTGTYNNKAIKTWIDDIAAYTNFTSDALCTFTKNWDDTYEYVYSWEDDHLDDEEIIPISNRDKYRMWLWEFGTAYYPNVTYSLKYTYCRKEGDTILYESNPSGASGIKAGNGVIFTWDTPTDTQITHIRVYRATVGGSIYYYDSEWAVTESNGHMSANDGELGALLVETNDPPPAGATIVAGPAFANNLFLVVDNLLYFSKPARPEQWPALYYIEVSPPHQPLKALCLFSGTLYAWSEYDLWQIQGTSYNSFFPIKMNVLTGAKNQHGVAVIPDMGILHVGNDGVYLWTPTGDTNITRDAFGCLFRATSSENMPYVYETYLSRCFFVVFKDKLFFFYPEATDTYPSNIIVTDIKSKRTAHYDYNGTQFTAACVDRTNDRLYACDSSGYIWQLENESATDDNGTAISWQIQSKSFGDPLRKYFPRYARYDVAVGTGATAQGDILLNETSKQAHTITGSRRNKARLIGGVTGDRLAVRITGTSTVAIYGAEVQ